MEQEASKWLQDALKAEEAIVGNDANLQESLGILYADVARVKNNLGEEYEPFLKKALLKGNTRAPRWRT